MCCEGKKGRARKRESVFLLYQKKKQHLSVIRQPPSLHLSISSKFQGQKVTKEFSFGHKRDFLTPDYQSRDGRPQVSGTKVSEREDKRKNRRCSAT